jgi:hypothetical protein
MHLESFVTGRHLGVYYQAMNESSSLDRRKTCGPGFSACCVVLAVLAIAVDGWAQVTGSDGSPGSPGAHGVNGSDGAPGAPGGDGIRQGVVTDGRNVFSAIGGRGGDGGDGRPPGQNGGSGGAGGAARATAITNNASPVFGGTSIDALGGYGGDGGQPGLVSGGSGGAGGLAEARADVVGAPATANAFGGHGGVGSGAGSQGGAGGDARTEVDGRSVGDAPVDVRATSTAGNGGTSSFGSWLGDGGHARSVARGSNVGTSSVYVSAAAQGGSGGRWFPSSPSENAVGGDGGSAEAEAYGESSNGGNVTVSSHASGGDAWRGRGGSIRLVDTVSGKTSGWLELYQGATGGNSIFGVGGDAESRLYRRDDDGGSINLVAIARGGQGGAGGGDAVAAVEGIGLGDVSVEASASAGIGTAADGSSGSARLDRVYGESLGGGVVSVRAALGGVEGAAVATDSRFASPDVPLDAIVDGIVEGTTSGRLQLIQSAVGARAIAAATGAGSIFRAGSALNRLERRVSAEDLDVTLASAGGAGVSVNDRIHSPSDGGNASTIARLVNESGGASFSGSARGGDAGIADSSARGGDASLDVEIETHGDGSDIRFNPSFSVQGGDSYRYGASESGTAGDAMSRSIARALGNSSVDVFDYAEGGQGRTSGNASSFASGANAGNQRVQVSSNAEVGRIASFGGAADWGVARSEAHGFSPDGPVEAVSTASSNSTSTHGFFISEQWTGGLAAATATADGASSRVRADSTGFAGAVGERAVATRASARGDGSGSIDAHAVTAADAPLATTGSGAEVSVSVGGSHARPGEWGRGVIEARADRADTDIVLGGEFAFVHDARENPSSAVFVSFLAIDLDDDDFATLAVRIVEDDQELLDRSFGDAASARAFFAEPLSIGALMLGLPYDPGYSSELVISVEGSGVSQGTDFRLALAVGVHVVPEPGVIPLIMFGLLILGSQRAHG